MASSTMRRKSVGPSQNCGVYMATDRKYFSLQFRAASPKAHLFIWHGQAPTT